jgi:hypothetical protein
MVGDRDKVLAAGFDGYIPKPMFRNVYAGMEAYLRPDQRSSCSKRRTRRAVRRSGPRPRHGLGGGRPAGQYRPAARHFGAVGLYGGGVLPGARGRRPGAPFPPRYYRVGPAHAGRGRATPCCASSRKTRPWAMSRSSFTPPGCSRPRSIRASWRWARPGLFRCRSSRSSCSKEWLPA